VSDRFVTRQNNLAQFLVHKGVRCIALVDDARKVVFSFADVPELQAHVEAFQAGATVVAADYGRAGAIVRSLAREAHFRFSAWERRIATGADASRMQPVRHEDRLRESAGQ
jgi:hypothetical protein